MLESPTKDLVKVVCSVRLCMFNKLPSRFPVLFFAEQQTARSQMKSCFHEISLLFGKTDNIQVDK